MEGITRLCVLQLGAKLGNDLGILGILGALGEDEGVGIRLLEQILGLMDLIGGIDRDQHGTDLGGRPKGNVPLRHIGGPDRYMMPCLDAECDE